MLALIYQHHGSYGVWIKDFIKMIGKIGMFSTKNEMLFNFFVNFKWTLWTCYIVCLADTQGISWPRQEGFGQDAQALFNELSRLIEKDGRLWFLGPSVAAGEAMAHRNS